LESLNANPDTQNTLIFQTVEEAVLDGLAGTVWRGIYLQREDMDENVVVAFAK
jgi:hypothetical protein